MIEKAHHQPDSEPQKRSVESELNFETPEGAVQWLSVFVPFFFTSELPLGNFDFTKPKDRDKNIEKLQQFVRIFLLINNYFNDTLNLTSKMKAKKSKHEYEEMEKKAKDKRVVARRAIAQHSEAMMALKLLPTSLKIPKKLPENFSAQAENQPADEHATQIFLLSCYLHDMRNVIAKLSTYLGNFDEFVKKTKHPTDAELDAHREYIQELITDLVFMNEGFDIRNEQFNPREEYVTFLIEYVENMVQKESTNHKINPFIEEKDRVDISFDFQVDEVSLAQRENMTVPFPVSAFVRVFTNVLQNIQRYYYAENEQVFEQRRLRVQMKVDATNLLFAFDDDGVGFPTHKKISKEELSQASDPDVRDAFVTTSQFDGEPIIPYLVQQKKTSGKGSGLGLSGIKEAVAKAGGSFLAGNRTSSTGARVELVIPLHQD